MNTAQTLSLSTAATQTLSLSTAAAQTNKTSTQTSTVRQIVRTLAQKWDLIAVVGLLTSCTAYGVFALSSVA